MRLASRFVLTCLMTTVLPGMALAGSTVSFKVGDEKVNAYLAVPAGAAPATPGVVVIHEWWGLNKQIKGVAERLADSGYLAIVPDLYRGKLPADPGLAHELMRGLNESRSINIVKGAVSYLRERDKASTRSVGLLGYCMGGRIVLASALRGAKVQATVMYYGSVETTEEKVETLKSPLLGIFGGDDRGVLPEDVRKFEAALKAADKDARIVIYPGLGHAFANEEQSSYDREMAGDAWALTQEFLRNHLGQGAAGKEARKAPGVPDKPAGQEEPPAAGAGSNAKPPEKAPQGPKPPGGGAF